MVPRLTKAALGGTFEHYLLSVNYSQPEKVISDFHALASSFFHTPTTTIKGSRFISQLALPCEQFTHSLFYSLTLPTAKVVLSDFNVAKNLDEFSTTHI